MADWLHKEADIYQDALAQVMDGSKSYARLPKRDQ